MSDLIDKYFPETFDEQPDYNIDMICKNCKGVDIRYSGEYYVCIDCGYTITNKIWVLQPLFIDNIQYQTRYSRCKHFEKILRSIQSFLICSVPDEVIDELKKETFTTIQELKYIMRQRKLKKYYLSIYWIYNRCKNQVLITLDKNVVFCLKVMFSKVNSTFIKIRSNHDEKRYNMLQYHYLLRKFFRILKKDCFTKHLFLMKDKNKIQYSEDLFEKICLDLDYQFIPEII